VHHEVLLRRLLPQSDALREQELPLCLRRLLSEAGALRSTHPHEGLRRLLQKALTADQLPHSLVFELSE